MYHPVVTHCGCFQHLVWESFKICHHGLLSLFVDLLLGLCAIGSCWAEILVELANCTGNHGVGRRWCKCLLYDWLRSWCEWSRRRRWFLSSSNFLESTLTQQLKKAWLDLLLAYRQVHFSYGLHGSGSVTSSYIMVGRIGAFIFNHEWLSSYSTLICSAGFTFSSFVIRSQAENGKLFGKLICNAKILPR